MENTGYRLFKPASGSQHTLIFVLGFLLFPIMGIIAFLTSADYEERMLGIVIFLFGALSILYILIRASAKGFKYGIGKDLMLQRGSKRRFIACNDIAGVTGMDEPELSRFMKVLALPIAEAKKQMSIGRWWENSKVYGEITLWVSVVITESEKISGGPLSITSYTLNIKGPVVILKLINGELLMLTPRQTDAFVAELRSRGVGSIDPADCINSIPSPERNFDREGNKKRGMRRRIMSIVMFFVIAGGVLSWFFTLGPGSEGWEPDTETEVEQTSVIRAAGAWDSDELFILAVRVEGLDLSYELQEGMSAGAGIEPFAAEAMAADCEKQTGRVITEEMLESMQTLIHAFTRIEYMGIVSNNTGDKFYAFDIYGSGLASIRDTFY